MFVYLDLQIHLTMSSIKFYYRSKKDISELTLRYSSRYQGIDFDLFQKTEISISKEDWTIINRSKITDIDKKNLKIEYDVKLLKLEKFILDNLPSNKMNISKNWLSETLKEFHNPTLVKQAPEEVTYWIQKFIKNAYIMDNPKGGIGLSKSRIDAYKVLLKQIEDFNPKLLIKECNKKAFDSYKKWNVKKGFAPTTLNKKLSDLKTICRYAKSEGIETSYQLDSVKIKKGNAYDQDMDVVYLNEQDLKKIEQLKLTSIPKINARKWLILACYTAQRGNALIERIKKENFHSYKDQFVIKFKQKKGNKTVLIPVLPKVLEIYKDGLPYLISIQKLNVHFKELGRLAQIDEPTIGAIRESLIDPITKEPLLDSKGRVIQRNVKKERPKWKYIASHIGRRSFCSNHYGKLRTPIIMRVSGHEKESTFLQYINQKADDHLDTFFEYYSNKEETKENGMIKKLNKTK